MATKELSVVTLFVLHDLLENRIAALLDEPWPERPDDDDPIPIAVYATAAVQDLNEALLDLGFNRFWKFVECEGIGTKVERERLRKLLPEELQK